MQDESHGHAAVHDAAPAAASTEMGPDGPGPQRPGKTSMGLCDWIREGLRASVFLKPRVASREPAALHLLAIVTALALLGLGMQRLEVPGEAMFSLRGWLTPWWTTAATILLVWCIFSVARRRSRPSGRHARVAAWFALLFVASLPLLLFNGALGVAWARGWMPEIANSASVVWALYALVWAWEIGLGLRIAAALGLRAPGLAVLAVGLLALNMLGSWQFRDRAWYPEHVDDDDSQPRLTLSQEVFESQQSLRDAALRAILPQRPGVVDVYGIVFAPYAADDVFLRESTMVTGLLRDRFDAGGRVVQLANHATTTGTLPWATPANLERAIVAIATKMDKEADVLVIYLTSHGASNFVLAAEHWPLSVPRLKPDQLRKALDDAGIRHRVIVVSACYSGGWIAPLAGDDTLVMTAADATHTSYGCGRNSPLTFFGRAVFDEQLRRTHSFEEAFTAAVPDIRQREIDGKKMDGFSNPQIRVGDRIRPVLAALAKRLDTQQPSQGRGLEAQGPSVAAPAAR